VTEKAMTDTMWNDLADQAYRQSRDAEDWARAANPKIAAERLRAYALGFEQGWRKAIAVARKVKEGKS